jgi:hypothetical protein
MTAVAALKKLIPVALKQPVRIISMPERGAWR